MIAPRLLDVNAAAEYLGGVSSWTIRSYVENGHLTPVRLPAVRGRGDNRRLLFAREDLDAFIEKQKATSTAAPNASLSQAAIKGWRQTPERKRRAS